MIKHFALLSLFFIGLNACYPDSVKSKKLNSVTDNHSFAKADHALVKHLDLILRVDFEKKILSGRAIWHIDFFQGNEIIFDTRDLNIASILVDGKQVNFTLDKPVDFLGSALHVPINKASKIVEINYATRPSAQALQWLEPSQTYGKKHPFLFTQGQAILTRSWLPCQDSPGIRFTYHASIKTPSELMAVMSAVNSQSLNTSGLYDFKQLHPIPAYLMALAVADLKFISVGPRTGVYAEPGMAEKAAQEFSDMEKMLVAAEKLYGLYQWGRYDVLVLPPSFPFGGMENPVLTFATPTVIAGDKSLVSLVAHEMAHSWSGNLVTNATWDDFWLNEGFTVYFERRICEAIYGKDFAEMEAVLGYQDWIREMDGMGETNKDTKLYLDLTGRDPDDGMTSIAYEKGYDLLCFIESKVGRTQFDKFLKDYFTTYSFHSMTTVNFIEILNQELLHDDKELNADISDWIYKVGVPAKSTIPVSKRLKTIDTLLQELANKDFDPNLVPDNLLTQQWLYLLRKLPSSFDAKIAKVWNNKFQLSSKPNDEIKACWIEVCIKNGYGKEIVPDIESFLVRVGRRKFLLPLYEALVKNNMKTEATAIFEKASPGYHYVSRTSIQELLDKGV